MKENKQYLKEIGFQNRHGSNWWHRGSDEMLSLSLDGKVSYKVHKCDTIQIDSFDLFKQRNEIKAGDRYKFPEGNKYIYGQDFQKKEGIPPNVIFTVNSEQTD